MKEKIINCYELDIKQDIPVELRKTKEYSQLLEKKNMILVLVLMIVCITLSSITYGQYVKLKSKQKHR
jgi:hypothetical protein